MGLIVLVIKKADLKNIQPPLAIRTKSKKLGVGQNCLAYTM